MNTNPSQAGLATEASRPRLLTVEEVAILLGVDPRTVWRLLSRKQLPEPVRFGRNTRWEENRITDWIVLGCPAQNGEGHLTQETSKNGIRL